MPNKYTAAAQEIWKRLKYQAQPGRMLAGLTCRRSGEFVVSGDDALPQITFVDIGVSETRTSSTQVSISMFLRTRRKLGLFKETDADPDGLTEWAAKVMDAVETMPVEAGGPDPMLTLTDADGVALPGGWMCSKEGLKWGYKMAEITDQFYTAQFDLTLDDVPTNRANRATSL